ncbi:hypothetical protein [Pseudactinotalea sp. HY158]|uniref:hypothetical protein n=1 Tax=Pseudactinotalea sp. HY158 TaxID=2654547 RepID=UPI00129C4017|nr:hypothetical protein [Pseudactinotalea sp. HY158]QGH68701.1 hypothetical protein GCE65_03695 [Pseudactinotalea sp. HY158]
MSVRAGRRTAIVHVVRRYSRQVHLTEHLDRIDLADQGKGPVRPVPVPRGRISDRLDDERCGEIVSAYLGGTTVAALARQFEISDYSVRRILIGAGVKRPARGLSDRCIAQAKSLRAAGMSFAEVGQQLGIAESTVHLMMAGSTPSTKRETS